MYYPYIMHYTRPPARTMTVTGIGKQVAQPDRIQIQLEVTTEHTQLTVAQEQNAVTMQRVLQSLRAIGVTNEQIETVSFEVYPIYLKDGRNEELKQYVISNAIRVTLDDLQQIGQVLDVAIQNGANQVGQLQFGVKDEAIYYHQALRKAIADAQSKARVMGDKLNVNVNFCPLEIIEEKIGQISSRQSFQAMSTSTSTPIEPSRIEFQATVKVQYQY